MIGKGVTCQVQSASRSERFTECLAGGRVRADDNHACIPGKRPAASSTEAAVWKFFRRATAPRRTDVEGGRLPD